jgi:hypothetical protein
VISRPKILTSVVALPALFVALLDWQVASAQLVVTNVGECHSETFDSMGAGISTPANWRVGRGASADITTIAVNDGSIGPGGEIAAFNFGQTIADPDRALGTIAASGDRNIELRLRNQTGRSIHSFAVRYDGEQWRIGTLVTPSALVLRYSADGIHFVDMGPGFQFTSPRLARPPLLQNTAVNGNEPNNRVAGIGGAYTPAAPVPDGAVIHLRWFDADDAGADPGLAIDNFSFSVTAVSEPPVAASDNHKGAFNSALGPAQIPYPLDDPFDQTDRSSTLDSHSPISPPQSHR